jgi:hypothetical protein
MLYTQRLCDAAVQDIQLELLRRTDHNAFDGEKIAASLLKHRSLWIAALLDRLGVANYSNPGQLFFSSLIKLRDLPRNDWNVDTLFLLTRTGREAETLAQIAEKEQWAADETNIYRDQDEIDRAVGATGIGFGLLSLWWD